MIFSPIFVFPGIKNHNTVHRYSGMGTVQVDPQSETLSIKAGREQITAKYFGTQLQSGDSVRYTLINDKLLLEKTSSASDHNKGADSFVQQQFPDFFNKISPLVDSVLMNIDKQYSRDQFQKDIYSILESLSGLTPPTDPEILKNITSLLESDGKDDSLSAQALRDLLLQLRQQFSKPIVLHEAKFIELPIDTLPGAILQFDQIDGFLDTLNLSDSTISELKHLLQSSNKQFIRTIPCGNKTLAALISSEDLLHEIKSLVENFSSRQMQSIPINTFESVLKNRSFLDLDSLNSIDLLLSNIQMACSQRRAGSESVQQSTINQWLLTALDNKSILPELISRYPGTATSLISQMNDSALLPSPENYGITADLLNSLENKADLIPSVIEKLGYNFENKLSNGLNRINQQSLKAVILNNLFVFGSEIPSAAIPQNTLYTPSNNLLQSSSDISDFLSTTSSEISELFGAISKIFNKDSHSDNVLSSISDSISKLSKLKNDLDDSNLKNEENLKSQKGNINSYYDATLPNLKKEVSQLLSKVANDLCIIRNTIQTTLTSISSDLFEKLMKLTETPSRSIEKFLIMNAETSLKSGCGLEVSKHVVLDDKNETIQFLPDKGITNDTITIDQPSKQIMDTLLNRLESLQLLTRITPTSDGEQQILALPMNVGGEWTEVNIRFLKKQKSRKKSVQNLYTVQLDVAPSKLGTITVRMEYELKKRFQLKITFDKKQTLEWFLQNRDTIGKSLCSLGLPLANLDLQSAESKKRDTEKLTLTSGAIDFKI